MFHQALRVIVASAVLCVQLLPAATASSADASLQMLIQKAQSLEARGREDLAAQVWQQVLVANPDHPAALAHLARWAKHTGQNEQASVFQERLRKVDPAFVQTLPDSVVDSPASRAKPRLEEAARLVAEQRFTDAMAIYRDVFGNNPPPGTWSIAYYETLAATPGGVDAALAGLKRLSAAYPTVQDYDLSIGRIMTYNPATRLAGVNQLSSVNESTALAIKAKSAWRQALLWEKLNPAFSESAKLYLSRYKDADLEAATSDMRARAAVKLLTPKPPDKDVQLGYSSLKAGAFDSAKNHFSTALNGDEHLGRAHEGLGFVAMKEGKFDEAVKQFELAKSSGSNPDVKIALQEARFWKTMQSASKALDVQDWKSATDLYQTALSIRPQNLEAMHGLGGALLAAGDPAKALPYLKQVVAQQPSNTQAWYGLVKASLDADGYQAALRIFASVPTAVTDKLADQVEWKTLRCRLYDEAGQSGQAQALYRELTASSTEKLPGDTQVELASLALKFNQPAQAAVYAARAVDLSSKNVAAWEVLLSSLIASHRPADALRIYDSMPKDLVEHATSHVGFQQSLASLKEQSGDLEGARSIVEALAKNSDQLPRGQRNGVRLHLADLDAKLGNTGQALTTLNELAVLEPENVAVVRAKILFLNSMKQNIEIVNAFSQVPQSMALKLQRDGDIVSILATAYAAEGRRESAIRLLQAYDKAPAMMATDNKDAQKLQLGWLLLDSPGSSAYLYRLLEEVNAEPALSTDSRKQLNDLWATWIMRSADASRKAGDAARALALLDQGSKAFPSNSKLQSAFAGNLLAAGQIKRAYNVYANWGLAGGQAEDFAGAIGAAMSQHESRTAETWINNALNRWPNNAKLLSLAGDFAQARGDAKHAQAYWKEALAYGQTEASNRMAQPPGFDSTAPATGLRSLLVTADADSANTSPIAQNGNEVEGRSERLYASNNPTDVHLSSYQPAPSGVSSMAPVRTSFMGETARTSVAPVLKSELPLADSLQDKIASIESRNSPYVSSRMSVWARGGQAGLSRLTIEQEEIEASATIANAVRASILLKPTYLSAGTADGSGTSLFGQQSKPAAFGQQNQSGVAGQAELSSQSVGLSIGSTPRGFETNSWVGGLRVQPWHGPITFLLERDNVKETLLSFSGARDPQSNQVWGGVMSNSLALQGHWGDSASGLYATAAYQILNGKNVRSNNAMNGNFGTWWKIGSIPEGSLTAGVNFSAMHYDQNLRYFTFGQGGYFSPQQYFLVNVPVHWTGTHGRLQYALGASVGLQHFVEDASDFYPTNAALQKQGNLQYSGMTSTGLNFNIDGKIDYQIAPHWLLGTFVTANNARNYTAIAAGLFVRYTFEARPVMFTNEASSIPDWRGQDPFKF